MKKLIILTLQLFLFWLIFFAVQHILFLWYNNAEIKNSELGEILFSFIYSLRIDISAICYLMSLPMVILILSLFLKNNKALIKSFHFINIFLFVLCLIICISDLALYSVWGTKINAKALSYLAFQGTAIRSFAAVPYWLFMAIIVIELFVIIVLYKRIFRIQDIGRIKILYKIIYSLILGFLLITGIRGGWQTFPINRSTAYYSKYAVLNYSAVNGFWNFMEVVLKPDIKVNPYNYFSKEKASAIVSGMYEQSCDSTAMILNNQKPNIVLILMESVSAECLESLNGIKGLMPGLDSLTKEGLLFTDFYANGFRTEQGLIAFLSSFPAQPQTTIMRKFGKFEKLPNLARTLDENGYSLNYYYSGDLEFANQNSYLNLSGFNHILNQDNYPWKRRTDWGAYDEELFECHLKEADKDVRPFFSIIMTSTNHEPFDAEVEKKYTGNSEVDNYKNTVHYTDKCLANYFRKVKSKKWYRNTLFIITSDHAHSYPMSRGANEVKRHWIPLLFYGNVLKSEYRGKTISTIGSQIDLPAMVLSQLKIPYQQFSRSKNLFNTCSPEFAFYTFDNGFGIITPKQTVVFDHNLNQVVFRSDSVSHDIDEITLSKGKSYLQMMFEEYIGFNN